MAQELPEVLDYRVLKQKLELIDSEWAVLKGLLTFKNPYKKAEPDERPVAYDDLPMDRDNQVVGFPETSAAVASQAAWEGSRGTVAVTSDELESLLPQGGENNQAGTLMERLIKVERQIHRITVLGIACMALTIALFGVFTFLVYQDNLVNRFASHQVKEITAPINASRSEPRVSAKDRQSPSAAAIVSPGDPQAAGVAPKASASEPQAAGAAAVVPESKPQASIPEAQVPAYDRQSPRETAKISPGDPQSTGATPMPADNVAQASETATAPAAAEPACKFVGSITSNKVHRPDCQWAEKIKPERLITFPSVAAAREQGYIPCPACRPQDSD